MARTDFDSRTTNLLHLSPGSGAPFSLLRVNLEEQIQPKVQFCCSYPL